MDDFLVYIVLGIIYLIFQALTSSKRKQTKLKRPSSRPSLPEGRPSTLQTGAEPSLDDALREIRKALGMDTPSTSPSRPSPPQPPPIPKAPPKKAAHPIRTHKPELSETAPAKSWSSEFKQYQTHYADETFEELPANADGDRFGQAPSKQRRPGTTTSLLPSTRSSILPVKQPAAATQSGLIRRIKDPQAARDAFIMSEIFGPPRALRRSLPDKPD